MKESLDRRPSVGTFQREMDRLFNEFFGTRRQPFGFEAGTPTFPPLRVWEDTEHLLVEAELPGVKMEDLDIQVHDNQLVLKGHRRFEKPERAQHQRQERGFGSFSRILRLPVEVDTDKAEARLKYGVLALSLPKMPAARTRRIEVKTG